MDAHTVRGHANAVQTAGADDPDHPERRDFVLDGGYGRWLEVIGVRTLRVGEPLVVDVMLAGSAFHPDVRRGG